MGMATASREGIDEGLRRYMLRVYNYMSLGLGLTGVVAFTVANTPSILQLFYTQTGPTILAYIAMFSPLVFVMVISFGIHKLSTPTVQALFWAFAGAMGLSLTHIFLVYTGTSIARVFFITASVFAAMSLYDGLTLAVRWVVTLGFPFVLGRLLARRPEDIRLVLSALVIAALLYSVPILWELRMSPQLHHQIFGINPGSAWKQTLRGEGYRPMVFIGHGLGVSMFVAMACVAAAGLWRGRVRILGVGSAKIGIHNSPKRSCRSEGGCGNRHGLQSTDEIQRTIEDLQRATDNAVKVMQSGIDKAHQSEQRAINAGETLESILDAVKTINELNLQIATAAEQQNVVTETINDNAINIKNIANHTADVANETMDACTNLTEISDVLQKSVARFSTK